MSEEKKDFVMTVREAAAMLRVSRGSAYQGVQRSQIPSIRVGKRILIPKAALLRMLEGNTGSDHGQK